MDRRRSLLATSEIVSDVVVYELEAGNGTSGIELYKLLTTQRDEGLLIGNFADMGIQVTYRVKYFPDKVFNCTGYYMSGYNVVAYHIYIDDTDGFLEDAWYESSFVIGEGTVGFISVD